MKFSFHSLRGITLAAAWTAALVCCSTAARRPETHAGSIRGRVRQEQANSAVTFTKDVAPILFHNCVSCHRPGQVAPFSLLTYKDARKRSQLIAQLTTSRYMPPWLPEPGHGDFLGGRRLTPTQIMTLRQWVSGGAREGDPNDLPHPPQFVSGWRLGPPDLVLKMPQAFRLAAETNALCPSFVIPLPLADDRWIRAVDFRPSRPRIARYASLFLDTTSRARRLLRQSGSGEYFAFEAGLDPAASRLADWAPGAAPVVFPTGMGLACRKGADLVVMLRLHPDGQPEMEQSQIGLYFTQAPRTTPAIIPLAALGVCLKANEQQTVTDEFTLPVAVRVLGITPHASPYARTIKADALLPDGTVKPLLWIRNWNADWAEPYRYAVPPALPPGTRLSVVCRFDNTARSPLNSPGMVMAVQPGTEYMDELAGIQIQVVPQQAGDAPRLARALQNKTRLPKAESTGGTGHG